MDEKGVVVIDSISPADPNCGDEVTVRFKSISGPGEGVVVQLWRQDLPAGPRLVADRLIPESALEDGSGSYQFRVPKGRAERFTLLIRLWNEIGSLTEHRWSFSCD
jgi:hypothetical protein